MTPAVAHRPRLAWDGARVIVAALEAGQDAWLAQIVPTASARSSAQAVADSGRRLAADTDAFLTEAGMWRVPPRRPARPATRRWRPRWPS
jgi:hypothetical protein